MKWLETIALNFGTCCHSRSFSNIEWFNKKMLIHQTVFDIQTKKQLFLYKVNTKNPTNTKRKLFIGVSFKKKIGLGSNHFL